MFNTNLQLSIVLTICLFKMNQCREGRHTGRTKALEELYTKTCFFLGWPEGQANAEKHGVVKNIGITSSRMSNLDEGTRKVENPTLIIIT